MQIDFTIDGETPLIEMHGMGGKDRFCIRSKDRRNEGIFLSKEGKWTYQPSWSVVVGYPTKEKALEFATKFSNGRRGLFNLLNDAATASPRPPKQGCTEEELLKHKRNHPSYINPETLGKVETVMKELRDQIHPPLFKRIADSLGEITR